ncbi:MAG: polar amino acid ABC transporter substrate-binding protein, partial [Microbacterium sp.]
MSLRTRFAALAASAALVLSGCSGTSSPASSSADDELGLVAAGTLTVATEGTYRPFSYHDQ